MADDKTFRGCTEVATRNKRTCLLTAIRTMNEIVIMPQIKIILHGNSSLKMWVDELSQDFSYWRGHQRLPKALLKYKSPGLPGAPRSVDLGRAKDSHFTYFEKQWVKQLHSESEPQQMREGVICNLSPGHTAVRQPSVNVRPFFVRTVGSHASWGTSVQKEQFLKRIC